MHERRSRAEGPEPDLHFGNKAKLEEIDQRTGIGSISMAGEQKRSHCFVKKNEEKSIRPQHLAPRRGMGRKIRTSAEKTLGKGMSPYGREVKQTTQTLRQGAKSSVSQRGRQ